MRLAVAAAALLFAPAAHAGSIELTDAAKVKEKFKAKTLQEVSVVGYLPTEEDVKAYEEIANQLTAFDFYHVGKRETLEALGMQSREKKSMITVYRPWASGKNFKSVYRYRITGVATNKARCRDWLLENTLEPVGFVPGKLDSMYTKASERLKKSVMIFYVNTEVEDKDKPKPDDWEQPETILDPEAKAPDDWDEEEDGEFVPDQVPNPEFKGDWHPSMKSLLIPDPDHIKPSDWDQPETIPDPKGIKPDDWDEEEDGPWEPPPEVPNPAFKGEWVQRTMVDPTLIKKIKDVLKPIQEKHSKKLLFQISDRADKGSSVSSNVYELGRWTQEFREDNDTTFSQDEYDAGIVVGIFGKKYSTLKYDNQDFGTISDYQVSPGKKFAFRGKDGFAPGALMEWADKFAAGKLTDENKAERLKREAEEKKRKAEAEKAKSEEKKEDASKIEL